MESLLQPLLGSAFTLVDSPVSLIELLAFALSLAMVGCNIRVHIAGWPLAIAASAMYGLLFWHHRLYGEAWLQVFFIAVAAWGWWQWRNGRRADGSTLQVRNLSARARLHTALAWLAAWPLLAMMLRATTDTDVPWWDAAPTAGSVIGQFLLARKFVDNWPVWVAVNVVSVGLFAWKGLWLTVLLYTLFTLLALWGWRAWWQRARTAR